MKLWKTIDVVAFILVVVGAINWGLIGFFEFNLVAALFGEMTALSRIIYALVGLAGVYEAVAVPGMLRRWSLAPHAAPARREEHVHV